MLKAFLILGLLFCGVSQAQDANPDDANPDDFYCRRTPPGREDFFPPLIYNSGVIACPVNGHMKPMYSGATCMQSANCFHLSDQNKADILEYAKTALGGTGKPVPQTFAGVGDAEKDIYIKKHGGITGDPAIVMCEVTAVDNNPLAQQRYAIRKANSDQARGGAGRSAYPAKPVGFCPMPEQCKKAHFSGLSSTVYDDAAAGEIGSFGTDNPAFQIEAGKRKPVSATAPAGN